MKTFATALVAIVLLAGCKSTPPQAEATPVWISTADLKSCEAMAIAAAPIDFPDNPVDSKQPSVFEVMDPCAVRLTVFLPVEMSRASVNSEVYRIFDKRFLVYTFQSTTPYYCDVVDVYDFSTQEPKKFEVVNKRLSAATSDMRRQTWRTKTR